MKSDENFDNWEVPIPFQYMWRQSGKRRFVQIGRLPSIKFSRYCSDKNTFRLALRRIFKRIEDDQDVDCGSKRISFSDCPFLSVCPPALWHLCTSPVWIRPSWWRPHTLRSGGHHRPVEMHLRIYTYYGCRSRFLASPSQADADAKDEAVQWYYGDVNLGSDHHFWAGRHPVQHRRHLADHQQGRSQLVAGKDGGGDGGHRTMDVNWWDINSCNMFVCFRLARLLQQELLDSYQAQNFRLVNRHWWDPSSSHKHHADDRDRDDDTTILETWAFGEKRKLFFPAVTWIVMIKVGEFIWLQENWYFCSE